MEDSKKAEAGFLMDLIKEDRNEIRIIKNRTYVEALIVAAFAIIAFLIKDGKGIGKTKELTIAVNIVFLTISWVITIIQYIDLCFVRKCLKWRECHLTRLGVDYFGHRGKCEYESDNGCTYDAKLLCKEVFPNDRCLFLPAGVLSIIYIIAIFWAACSM